MSEPEGSNPNPSSSMMGGIGTAMMGMMNNLHTDAVARRILMVLDRFEVGTQWRHLVGNTTRTLFQVVMYLCLQRYLSKPEWLGQDLKRLGWYLSYVLLYRKQRFRKNGPGMEAAMATEIARTDSEEVVNGFPIYTVSSENEVTLWYARGIHTSTVRKMELDAIREHAISTSGMSQLYRWDIGKYFPQPATQLFGSRNFLNLQGIVEKYVLASQRLQNFSTVGILIDGEPGLGKSMSIHYLATQNSIKRLYRIDLSSISCLKAPAEKLLTECYHKIPITESTLFLFDEIDKWLEYQISYTFESAKNSKEESDPKRPKKVEPRETREEREERFRLHSYRVRTNFLFLVLSILERTGHSHPCLVIFGSNNFDSIFGDLDLKHYRSLQSRFQRLTFHRCQREEIQEYLRYNNRKFVGCELYDPGLESRLDRVPFEPITYRKLTEIAVLSGFHPERIVEKLCHLDSEVAVAASSLEDKLLANSSKLNLLEDKFLTDSSLEPRLELVAAGVGGISTYEPIPAVFLDEHRRYVEQIPRECRCKSLNVLACDCNYCQHHRFEHGEATHGCHWCVTGEERWEISETLSPGEVGDRIRELEQGLTLSGPTDQNRAYLEYIATDSVVLAARSKNGGGHGVLEKLTYNLRFNCGGVTEYIDLYDQIVRKWSQPLPILMD